MTGFAEKDLGIVVVKLNMNQQSVLAAERAKCILGLICKTVASRPRELIHPSLLFGIYKAAPGLPLQEILTYRSKSKGRPLRWSGLEHRMCAERLEKLGLFSLGKRHLFAEILLLFIAK